MMTRAVIGVHALALDQAVVKEINLFVRNGTSGKETCEPTCPLPPRENRETARILAGEKAYAHPLNP